MPKKSRWGKRPKLLDILTIDFESLPLMKYNKEFVESFRRKTYWAINYAKNREKRTRKAYERSNLTLPYSLEKGSVIEKLINKEDIANLDYSQLINQYNYAYKFLNESTSVFSRSTIQKDLIGWEGVTKNFVYKVKNTVKDLYNIDVTVKQEDLKNFWELYNRVHSEKKVKDPVNYEIYRDVALVVEKYGSKLNDENFLEEIATYLKNGRDTREIISTNNEETPSEISIAIEDLYGRH